MWEITPLPIGICADHPELSDYGLWRKLKDGQWEHISFCDPKSHEWLGIYSSDLEELLDRAYSRK